MKVSAPKCSKIVETYYKSEQESAFFVVNSTSKQVIKKN